VHLTLRGRYGARSTRTDPDDDTSSVMHVAAPIHDGARIAGVLTVSKPNRAMAPFIARSEGVILRWGLVLLGAALLVGLVAAWWLSRQLGGLRRYADAVTAGERAVPPDAAGEFGDLGRALAGRDIGAGIWGFEKRESSYRVTVTDDRGIVVFDSAGRDVGADYSQWNDVHLTLRGRYGARSTRSDPDDDTSSVMHVAAPIRDGGRIAGVLTVSKPNRAMAPFIARSEGVILRWGLVLLGSALLVGLLAAWWLSRQLGGLRRYADAVTAGRRAVPPDAAGEFGDLGRALETMRDRLEDRRYVERYVHALTHELKSPLSAIRGSAELLESPLPEADRRRFAAHIGAQSERMAAMIDKLLALAAVEHRQRIERPEAVVVAELVDEVLADAGLRASEAGVLLRAEVEAGLPELRGDRFLLRQMLGNLVDNAIDFSPEGGTVLVGATQDGQGLRLEVADRGAGIPEYATGRVFERFYRGPRAGQDEGAGKEGMGLGLAIVEALVRAHDGEVAVESRPGEGSRFVVRFPSARVRAS